MDCRPEGVRTGGPNQDQRDDPKGEAQEGPSQAGCCLHPRPSKEAESTYNPHPSPPIQRTPHPVPAPVQHMRVDLRGGDVLVPKQFLDRPNVVAVAQQMRGKRMP